MNEAIRGNEIVSDEEIERVKAEFARRRDKSKGLEELEQALSDEQDYLLSLHASQGYPYETQLDAPEGCNDDDPMREFYRVKENFRELFGIIQKEGIAGLIVGPTKVFWLKDVDPTNAAHTGYRWIMTNRVFWPVFEQGKLVTEDEALMAICADLARPLCDSNDSSLAEPPALA